MTNHPGLEPGTLRLLSTIRSQFPPKVVDLFLCFAVDNEGYGFSEFEMWAGVYRREVLSLEFKLHGHYRPFRSSGGFGARFVIPRNFPDLGILKDRLKIASLQLVTNHKTV